MIRNPLAPFALLGAMLALVNAPAGAQSSCGPRGQLVKLLSDQYREDPVGMGLAQPGQVLEIFTSPNGTWSMVMTMPDVKACLVAAEDNWEMVSRIKGNPI